jgi:hypothetical protein
MVCMSRCHELGAVGSGSNPPNLAVHALGPVACAPVTCVLLGSLVGASRRLRKADVHLCHVPPSLRLLRACVGAVTLLSVQVPV